MPSFLDALIDPFLARHRRGVLESYVEQLGSPQQLIFVNEFLQILLHAMSLHFILNGDFRRNIEEPEPFRGKYAFRSQNETIAASAEFEGGRMKVHDQCIGDTNVAVTFKDEGVLMQFLFDKDPDIIAAILDQEIRTEGNLNYLMKFVYMTRLFRKDLGL